MPLMINNKTISRLLAACSLCCGVAAALSSCNDFLDIKPYDRTVPETTEDFAALVHNLCNDIDNGSGVAGEAIGEYSETVLLEADADNMATNLTGGTDRLRTYIGTDLSGNIDQLFLRGSDLKHPADQADRCRRIGTSPGQSGPGGNMFLQTAGKLFFKAEMFLHDVNRLDDRILVIRRQIAAVQAQAGLI